MPQKKSHKMRLSQRIIGDSKSVRVRERRGGACLELVEYVSKKLWRPVSDRRSLAANSVKGAWLARSFTLSTNNYLGSWIPGLKAWPSPSHPLQSSS
jgi:hypothetical protein